MSSKPTLKLDWCSHEAAKYACEKWHYSRSMSSARNVYIGVWEGGIFVGAIVFGIGAGNATNGERFGLNRVCEMAELTRVALSRHRSEVSRILAIAIRLLRSQSPGLRLIISMADPKHGHHGGIYQAGGWVYTGKTKPDVEYRKNGKWVHHRTATSSGSAKGLPSRPLPAKYRYLMPLDDEMRQRIEPLRKPYPKRVVSVAGDTSAIHAEKGGSIPTTTLSETKSA